MREPELQPPARGTRPTNRRAVTLNAATELFARRGYGHVGMNDIAKATNVGASALYRHFSSKADLLVAAIRAGIAPYAHALAEAKFSGPFSASDLDTVVRQLAEIAVDHRRIGVLWQREARNLTDEKQAELRDELIQTSKALSTFVLAARPDIGDRQAEMLAWCAMGALASIGFHSLELARGSFVDLLVDIVGRIMWTPLPALSPGAQTVAGLASEPVSEGRKDRIVTVATELFAEKGFVATSIDEIGEAAGIAGPSVYVHFASKQAILVAALSRAGDSLQHDLSRVLRSADSTSGRLGKLVDSYVRFATRDRFVLRTLLSEMEHLPTDDRASAREEQRRYVDAWVGLFLQWATETPVAARIRVQALLLVVNDSAQTPRLRAQPGFAETLTFLSRSILGLWEH
jgi:AcrR family transcriptional regulator